MGLVKQHHNIKDMSVNKSYNAGSDPVWSYCMANSHLHPAMEALQEATLKVPRSRMLGAPECLLMNQTLIRAKAATKVLDVGMFTGASALAAALALDKDKADSRVVTCDVSDTHLELARQHWEMAGVDQIVDFRLGRAADTLQSLIDNGEAGTFDFVFVDADKANYDAYYEKGLVLLRRGGVMAFDNTLWSGAVVTPSTDPDTVALQKLNEKLANDKERVFVVQLNIGDGYTLATKI